MPAGIDPDRPPKNFKEAMARPDREQCAKAYQKEYQGFKDRNVLSVMKLPQGAKVLGTTTRMKYKINNGVFEKFKVRICVRGDQQQEGVDFNASDLYSPVLKAPEARLLAAIVHHLMEYLAEFPSFKLTYRRRSALSNGLSGYCDSDWANSLSRRSTTGPSDRRLVPL
jgi:hypothetical protein